MSLPLSGHIKIHKTYRAEPHGAFRALLRNPLIHKHSCTNATPLLFLNRNCVGCG